MSKFTFTSEEAEFIAKICNKLQPNSRILVRYSDVLSHNNDWNAVDLNYNEVETFLQIHKRFVDDGMPIDWSIDFTVTHHDKGFNLTIFPIDLYTTVSKAIKEIDKIKKYTVNIEESINQEFEVEASDPLEAIEIATKKYKDGEFVLDDTYVSARQIAVVKPDEESTEWIEI